MKPLLKNQVNAVLASAALLFIILIIGAFVWGIGDLFALANRANQGSGNQNPAPSFDLAGAAKLDYRGTMPQ